MTGIQSINQTKNCQPLALTNNHEVDWSTKPFDYQFRRNARFDACLYMLGVRHKVSKLAICRTINSVCYTGFFREKGKGKGNCRREKQPNLFLFWLGKGKQGNQCPKEPYSVEPYSVHFPNLMCPFFPLIIPISQRTIKLLVSDYEYIKVEKLYQSLATLSFLWFGH